MEKEVTLRFSDQWDVGKCRKGRLYLRDRTISPKAKSVLYFYFEPRSDYLPKQLNDGVCEGKTAAGRALNRVLFGDPSCRPN
jgi:hypothetical protein